MTSPKPRIWFALIIVFVALSALAGAFAASAASNVGRDSLPPVGATDCSLRPDECGRQNAVDETLPGDRNGASAAGGPTAICNVPSPSHLTIQSAVHDGLCEVISLTGHIYTETVAVSRTVTIVGQSDVPTIIDGEGRDAVFSIYPGVTASLSNLTIQNGFGFYGGGIFNNNGNLTVSRCTITGNVASRGGGIDNWGTLTLSDSTISGNFARRESFVDYGGGINNYNNATLTVANSTITANVADNGGGGIFTWPGSSTTLSNSIIAGNPVGGNCVQMASITSAGYNISNDSSCNLVGTGDRPNTDPMLGPLGYNGGPTPTHALKPGSPAIDAGSCSGALADQRGFHRPIDLPGIANADDGCDIGAYERAFTLNLPEIIHQAYLGPWEVEPNNSRAQANGFLAPNHTYFGHIEVPTEDYYYFYWSGSGTLHVDVQNFLKNQWVIIYFGQDSDPVVQEFTNAQSFVVEVSESLARGAGTYYIRFYSDAGAAEPYSFSYHIE